MEKKIVAHPIPPDQPEAPPAVLRIALTCVLCTVITFVLSMFWAAATPWLLPTGTITFCIALLLLLRYCRFSGFGAIARDIRKLYG